MKRFLFFLVLGPFFFTSFAQEALAQAEKKANEKDVTVKWQGDTGEFQYPWKYGSSKGDEFAIWQVAPNGTKGGEVAAIIQPSTKIVVKNISGIDRNNLSLLNGKKVTALAKIRTEGFGEGSEDYCLELILVVSER